MLQLGPGSGASCFVFTYKEGLLSAVAHDLKLAVGAFSIELADDRTRVEGRFDARSLRVQSTMRDGRDGTTPSERDRRSIEASVADEVLRVRRFPEVRFVSTAVQRDDEARARVVGELTLHGVTRPLTVVAERVAGQWVGRARIEQLDFGIKPYSAMLGTLRVRSAVDVEVRLPL